MLPDYQEKAFVEFLAAVKAAGGSSNILFEEVVPESLPPRSGFITRYGRKVAKQGKVVRVSALPPYGSVVVSGELDFTPETVEEIYNRLHEAGCETND